MIETARRVVVVLVVLAVLFSLALTAIPGIGLGLPLAGVIVSGLIAAGYLVEPLRELADGDQRTTERPAARG